MPETVRADHRRDELQTIRDKTNEMIATGSMRVKNGRTNVKVTENQNQLIFSISNSK
jgi:hypothetical protein